jgi:hypothetical protein
METDVPALAHALDVPPGRIGAIIDAHHPRGCAGSMAQAAARVAAG